MSGILKNIYYKYENAKIIFKEKEYCFKIILTEYLDILSNRKLYQKVKLTKEQKQNIDSFWKKYYGKKVSYLWHKLYTAVSNEFHVEYVPEYIYSAYLEPNMVKYDLCKTFSDKSLLDIFYNNVTLPKTIGYNSSGLFYDEQHNLITQIEFKRIINQYNNFIIKPTIDSGAGRNIRFVKLVDGKDKNSGESIESILNKFNSNYIIQEILEQHEDLSRIYPKSINTLRIITYIIDSEIKYMKPCLRIGLNGSQVDNWHYGGIAIGCDFDGSLHKYGFNDKGAPFFNHPDTGITFDKYKIPNVLEALEKAKELHQHMPHARIISWDFMIDSKERIVLIEANYKAQGTRFNQICHSTLFGEDTSAVLRDFAQKRNTQSIDFTQNDI